MARILVIDDEDPILALLREHLEHAGHEVIEAHNGQQGLDLFRQGGANLVITDIVMPEKEGFAVLQELREEQPPVKVLVIYGGGLGSAASHLEATRLLGTAKVLFKPFSIAALLVAVDEVLSGHG